MKVMTRVFNFLTPKSWCSALGALDFLGGAYDKESARHVGGLGSIPGFGRSAEEHGSPFQYSCLENSIDRRAWRAIVHGVAKIRVNN